jgi:hypothetical protein
MPELQHMVFLAYGMDVGSKTGTGQRWVLDARQQGHWVQIGPEVSHDDAEAARDRLATSGVAADDLRVRRVGS